MRRTIELYLAVVVTFYLAQVFGGPYGAVDLLVIEPVLAIVAAAVVTPFLAYGLRRRERATARAAADLAGGAGEVVADCTARSRPAGGSWTRWRNGRMHVTETEIRCDHRLRGGTFLRIDRSHVIDVTTRAVASRETFYVNAACTIVVLALADGDTVEIGVLAPVADAMTRAGAPAR